MRAPPRATGVLLCLPLGLEAHHASVLLSCVQLGDSYLAGLNILHPFVVPQPPQPPRPPSRATDTPPDTSPSSTGLSSGARTGIIVGATVGGVLLLSGAALAVAAAMAVLSHRTHRRWGLFGKHVAPGVGPSTTLVVTDIENSTSLW